MLLRALCRLLPPWFYYFDVYRTLGMSLRGAETAGERHTGSWALVCSDTAETHHSVSTGPKARLADMHES